MQNAAEVSDGFWLVYVLLVDWEQQLLFQEDHPLDVLAAAAHKHGVNTDVDLLEE